MLTTKTSLNEVVKIVKVNSSIKQRAVLPTGKVILYFFPQSYGARAITIKIFTLPF